jgi:hypothetical protein
LLYSTYVGQGDDDAAWSSNSISYSYSNLLMNNWNRMNMSQQQIIGGVEEAMGVWTAVTPLQLYERISGRGGPVPASRDD